ncbi:MAG: hypothetical protein SynsKO_35510 [Synoicihabitans sp.]
MLGEHAAVEWGSILMKPAASARQPYQGFILRLFLAGLWSIEWSEWFAEISENGEEVGRARRVACRGWSGLYLDETGGLGEAALPGVYPTPDSRRFVVG